MVETPTCARCVLTSRPGAAARPWRALGGALAPVPRAGGLRPAARPGARDAGQEPDGTPLPPEALHRERHLSALILDELRRQQRAPGRELPRDKRLRHLCETMLADPTHHETLADWARHRRQPAHRARLFRQELAAPFTQWRQQVILARAVTLAAGRRPINQIAAELGWQQPQRLQRNGAPHGVGARGSSRLLLMPKHTPNNYYFYSLLRLSNGRYSLFQAKRGPGGRSCQRAKTISATARRP